MKEFIEIKTLPLDAVCIINLHSIQLFIRKIIIL